MATTQRFDTAYGLSQPLLNEFPAPLVANRAPTTADKAQLGTLWINKTSNAAFVLTSVVNNSATWLGFSSGSATLSSLTVTPGDIDVTNGNINVAAGHLVVEGNITSNSGNIIAATGNINATAGGLAVATDIETTTGNIVATLGNIVASTGNIVATAGNITASAGDITAVAGDIVASTGAVNGVQVEATGDLGGLLATTSFTNGTNTSQSTGTLVIKSTTANPGNNAGFLKIYVGTTTAFVPYYTNIAP